MLGYMRADDVVCMLEHYFQVPLNEAQKKRVLDAIQGNPLMGTHQLNLIPAQVEQYTASIADDDDASLLIEPMRPPPFWWLDDDWGGGRRRDGSSLLLAVAAPPGGCAGDDCHIP